MTYRNYVVAHGQLCICQLPIIPICRVSEQFRFANRLSKDVLQTRTRNGSRCGIMYEAAFLVAHRSLGEIGYLPANLWSIYDINQYCYFESGGSFLITSRFIILALHPYHWL